MSKPQAELLESLNVKCSKCGGDTTVSALFTPPSTDNGYGFICEKRHVTPVTMDHIVSLVKLSQPQ